MALYVSADETSYYFWKGKLGNTEVKMACAVKDDIMTGEIFQNIDGETVVCNVAGLKNGNLFDIKAYREIEGEGIVHIYFLRAEIKNGAYNSPYIEGKTFNFSGWDHGGEYIYENHMGVKGELTLWYKPDNESFTLSIRRDSEGYGAGNDALVGINGITPDQETGNFVTALQDCNYRFSVRFYDHFLVIRQLSGSPAKCFGSGAGIVGIYIMVPAKG